MTVGFNNTPGSGRGSPEPTGERARRIEQEAEILARCERDIDAGIGIEDDEMEQRLAELDRINSIQEPLRGPARRV